EDALRPFLHQAHVLLAGPPHPGRHGEDRALRPGSTVGHLPMGLAKLVFWTSFLLVAHTYLLYPVVLFLAYSLVQMRRDWHYLRSRRDSRSAAQDAAQLPPVTLVIAAYNEEARLQDKLANLRP